MGFLAVIFAFAVGLIASVHEHERTARTLRLLDEGYLPLAIRLGQMQADEGVFETMVDRLEEEGDRATTLEWQLPSPPAFHSYDKLPELKESAHH